MPYYLTGVEHESRSALYGQVAVPVINLWDSPERKKVKGHAKHGARVQILETKQGSDGRTYHRVRAGLLAHGWVSAPFVQKGE